jgi:hypothetical protein
MLRDPSSVHPRRVRQASTKGARKPLVVKPVRGNGIHHSLDMLPNDRFAGTCSLPGITDYGPFLVAHG